MNLRQVEAGHVGHAIARVLERTAQLSGRPMPASAIDVMNHGATDPAIERRQALARRPSSRRPARQS